MPSGSRVEADAIGEQQPKRTIGKQLKRTQSRAAAEADASGEQQLKADASQDHSAGVERIDAIARGAAAEEDAIGEQQLCTESYPAPDYSRRRTRGSS